MFRNYIFIHLEVEYHLPCHAASIFYWEWDKVGSIRFCCQTLVAVALFMCTERVERALQFCSLPLYFLFLSTLTIAEWNLVSMFNVNTTSSPLCLLIFRMLKFHQLSVVLCECCPKWILRRGKNKKCWLKIFVIQLLGGINFSNHSIFSMGDESCMDIYYPL